MSALSNLESSQTRIAPLSDLSAIGPLFDRLLAAWKAHRQASADRRIDGYFRRERSEHERFLSNASDHYELERLERAWSRRHDDVWRVY